MAVKIRQDISAEEVYKAAKNAKKANVRARMLGIAAVLEGKTRTEASKIAGLDSSNFRDWVVVFNQQGIQGLYGKKRLGKKSTWTPEIEQFLKEKATEGASFEKDKQVTYRLEDFQKLLYETFGIRYGISTIWYALKRLGLSWVSVRKQHPKTDLEAQEEFKKKTPIRLGKYKLNTQQKK